MCDLLTSGDLLIEPICILLISSDPESQYDHFEWYFDGID